MYKQAFCSFVFHIFQWTWKLKILLLGQIHLKILEAKELKDDTFLVQVLKMGICLRVEILKVNTFPIQDPVKELRNVDGCFLFVSTFSCTHNKAISTT